MRHTLFVSLAIVLGALIIAQALRPPDRMVAGDLPFGPFRPRPKPPAPSPPEPTPAPLDEQDGRLFARLRPHFERFTDERSSKKIEAAFAEAADQINRTSVEGGELMLQGEPSQFLGASLFAGAIAGFIKKIIWTIVMGIVGAAIIALLAKYWMFLAPAFVAAVTFVAWPAGWAAAKFALPKKE